MVHFYLNLPPVSFQLVHSCTSDVGTSDLVGLPRSLFHPLQLLKCSGWLPEIKQGHFSLKFQTTLWKAFSKHKDCPETAPHAARPYYISLRATHLISHTFPPWLSEVVPIGGDVLILACRRKLRLNNCYWVVWTWFRLHLCHVCLTTSINHLIPL